MIAQRLQEIHGRMGAAALRAGRDPGEVRLLAVTKTVDVERVREAIAAGHRLFGENYVQEAQAKISALGEELRAQTHWHFIGHLQRNKAKVALPLFDCVETVDSLRLAETLDRLGRSIGRRAEIYVQVNLAGEGQKSGLAPGALPDFLRKVAALGQVRVVGLMTLPPWSPDPEASRPWFRRLRELRDELQAQGHDGLGLSMGMSNDFEVAVEEGATVVRVGTALFGARY